MVLWWIGNIVLLVVIAPVVVFLLYRVLVSAQAVRQAADEIAAVGTTMVYDVKPVPKLLETESYVSQTTAGLARYGKALDEML